MSEEELKKTWKNVLSDIELQIPKASFATWMRGSNLLDKKDGIALIGLPNQFTKLWVENKYNKIILGSIRLLDETTKNLKFVVYNTDTNQGVKKTELKETPFNVEQLEFSELKIDPDTQLNPKYTFNCLVVGSANELAYAAAQGIIQEIGKKYNPLFIYGGVGLGKTHLIQAIGNKIKEIYQNRVKVRYVTSERFTNDIITAIRNKRMEEMKKKYREVDVLIIDDIQFIAGKEKTEEEFFLTFNALYELNKQIIISSDRPPQAIPILEERLRSRFEGGMIVDVSIPDYEMRVAIIKTKLEEKHKKLSDEVIEVITERVKRNIRELEGILNLLFFHEEQRGINLTKETAEEIIKKHTRKNPDNITPSQIIKSVAMFFEISVEELVGHCRKKEIVVPRQIAMYFLRDSLELSYPHIGDIVGKRDHTTVIHAYEKIKQEIHKNNETSNKLNLIKELINKNKDN